MNQNQSEDDILIAPILKAGKTFWRVVFLLVVIILWAAFAWSLQAFYGLGLTGLNRPVYWGIYITNFVFFIGISHAGTLISAILRLCRAEWRRPITRMAEVITVLVLFFGVSNILFDLGRPERALNVIFHPNFRSPLLWDVCSITLYLTASSIYLYLPLIPDLAILRDRVKGWRNKLYKFLSVGWIDTDKQKHRLEIAISIMAVLVIPIAVSVHTVVSWVFAMTIQPMWHSTIFGPYFVVGAIFSGIAAIIITMVIIRKVYHLENYIKPIHFNYLGILLLLMTLLWLYFTGAEYITTWYGNEPMEMSVLYAKVSGPYSILFWIMVLCCFIIPFGILCNSKTRTITGTLIASISVSIGMWLERFTIVVPSLVNPRLSSIHGVYVPTWIEWSIMAGCFSAFILLYMVFTKFFPIVSIWEIKEGRESAIKKTTERISTYLPEKGSTNYRSILIGLVLCVFLLLSKLGFGESPQGSPGPLPENPIEGAKVFVKKKCIKCHAIRGEGGKTGPDLGRIHLKGSLLDVAGILWNHAPSMKEKMIELKIEHPSMTSVEMANIIAFLTAYQYYLTDIGVPGTPQNGKQLFEKKGCIKCHNVEQKNDKHGPPLGKYKGELSPIVMAQAMWNHGPQMIEAMKDIGIARPKFQGSEMVDLLAYLEFGTGGKTSKRVYVTPGSPSNGALLFNEKKCLKCHTVRGKGGSAGPDLGRKTEELTRSVSQIAGLMWNHAPEMWKAMQTMNLSVPKFSGEDMADIIAYLYFINYFDEPGDIKKGKKLFNDKQCIQCHALHRGSDSKIKIKDLKSPIDVIASMWNRVPAMQKAMQDKGILWPRFDRGEMKDILEFILSFSKE